MLVFLILFLLSNSFQLDDVQTKQIPDILYDELNIKDKELLNKLKKYEIVHPEDTTPTANEFPDFYSQGETVERSISFLHNGKKLVLDLVPNRNLVSPRYKERYYLPDGNTALRERTHDCFFHGHVRSEEQSNLALTTCEGFHGYIRRHDETFFIQPLFDQDRKRVAHVVYSPSDITGEKFQCPHDGIQTNESGYDFLNRFPLDEHHRSRRDVLTEIKYVELILVNDNSQFQRYRGDIGQTKLRAISIANVVDSDHASATECPINHMAEAAYALAPPGP
ncbi:Hypothetical predicted protein [Paramuricea clavata]|uniref:Peptidase M12B propeptide domain-containing protein n=1 Tax=Paramuricea clavata TaxID=317549 RepID=A0A7D9IHY3_PARCT|nr:Hypothetical predicted protein [Paramuricea clavata]